MKLLYGEELQDTQELVCCIQFHRFSRLDVKAWKL